VDFFLNLFLIVGSIYFQDAKISTIFINPDKDKEIVFKLSEFCNNITYIKLQTNDKCVIAKISKVKLDGEYIFIISQNLAISRLFVFKSNGDFITEIGIPGRGPAEYSSVLDFTLDKARKIVYILDTMGKILQFDYSGKYIKSTKLKSNPTSILFVNNALILISAWPDYYLNNGYGIEVKNLTNNESNYLLNRKFVTGKRTPGVLIFRNYFLEINSNENISFYEEKFDTLYHISLNNSIKIEPNLVLKLKNDLPINLITNNEYSLALKTHSVLTHFIEVKDFIFFSVFTPSPLKEYFYSIKKSSFEISKHNVSSDNEYFKNDFYQGITFKPQGVADEGILYSVIDCYKLSEYFLSNPSKRKNSNNQRNNELVNLVLRSSINDNPFILLMYFK
jgi:hypothetical protein